MYFIHRLKKWATALKTQITALYIAYQRPDVPLLSKVVISLVIAYAVSPIDLIPDFIPVLGWLDDLLLLPLGCWLAIQLMPTAIWLDCREKAQHLTIQLPRKRWIVWGIVTVWCLLAVWLLFLIWPYIEQIF